MAHIRQIKDHQVAYIQLNGDVQFFGTYDRYHSRAKGPALIWNSGYVRFTTDSQYSLHRTDGPAEILADGRKDYWVEDEHLSPDEFFLKYGTL